MARAYEAVARFPGTTERHPHGLPNALVVSLTSYPGRFSVLPLTLKSLLDQTVVADRLVLWIAEADWPKLTPDILALSAHGLEIRACADLRSYKKIIPSLIAWPDAFIATADDDVYYEPGWLASLVEAHNPVRPAILGRRAHRPARLADGTMRPYQDWEMEVRQNSTEPSANLFPTGVGGVLYPPGLLDARVTDADEALRLAPYGDDIWLFWMAHLAGTGHRQIGRCPLILEWEGSQQTSLYSSNFNGRNDHQIRMIEQHFGPA